MHTLVVLVVVIGAIAVLMDWTCVADVLPLSGEWRFAMGHPQPHLTQGTLPALEFADTIQLPSTTETCGKGKENAAREIGRLTRIRYFDGPAWYQCDVTIPEVWTGKRISLFLERTKYTQVWLGGHASGRAAASGSDRRRRDWIRRRSMRSAVRVRSEGLTCRRPHDHEAIRDFTGSSSRAGGG